MLKRVARALKDSWVSTEVQKKKHEERRPPRHVYDKLGLSAANGGIHNSNYIRLTLFMKSLCIIDERFLNQTLLLKNT